MSGAGFAVDQRDKALMAMRNMQVMELEQAEIIATLDQLCRKNLPVNSARWQLVMGLVLPADAVANGFDMASWMHEPMMLNLHQMRPSSGLNDAKFGAKDSTKDTGADLTTQVKGATSLAEATDVLAKGLAGKLCKVLSVESAAFDLFQALHVYGVDSLIAVEIRKWFLHTLKVEVAVFEILGGATVQTLSRAVVEKLRV